MNFCIIKILVYSSMDMHKYAYGIWYPVWKNGNKYKLFRQYYIVIDQNVHRCGKNIYRIPQRKRPLDGIRSNEYIG